MPKWQELGWPSQQAWIDAGSPDMTPAEWLNSDEPAAGGTSTKKELTPYAGTSESRLNELFTNGQLSEAEYRTELQARNKGVAAIDLAVSDNAPQAQAGKITPPSLAGGAGLAERLVQGDRGEWYVVNRAGETLAGPISTKEAAENELENMQLGITRPATATQGATGGASGGSTGGGGGSGGGGTAGGGGAAMTLEQQQAANRDARAQAQQQAEQMATDYAARNPGYVVEAPGIVVDTKTGKAYQIAYSKQFGWEPKEINYGDPAATRAKYTEALGGNENPSLLKTVIAMSGFNAANDAYAAAHGGEYAPAPVVNAWLDQQPGQGVSSIGSIADPRRAQNLATLEATGMLYSDPRQARAAALAPGSVHPSAGKTLADLGSVQYTADVQALADLGSFPVMNEMDRNLYDVSPEFYAGPQASGNARISLPGGEEVPLYGGALGAIGANAVDPGQGQRIATALQQGGAQGEGVGLLSERDMQALGQAQMYAQQQAGGGEMDFNAWAQGAGFAIQLNRETDKFEIIDINGNVVGSYPTQAAAQASFGVAAYKYQQAQQEARSAFVNRSQRSTPQTTRAVPLNTAPNVPKAPRPPTPVPLPEPELPVVPPFNAQPFKAPPNFRPVYGFDEGGVVPGPVGQPQAAIVHGGETILPTHKMQPLSLPQLYAAIVANPKRAVPLAIPVAA